MCVTIGDVICAIIISNASLRPLLTPLESIPAPLPRSILLAPLESTLAHPLVSGELSPLAATLTKNRGGTPLVLPFPFILPPPATLTESSLPISSHPTPSSSFRYIPGPVSYSSQTT